jgi:hypothetical protein
VLEKKAPTLTVGITTCYGGKSLVKAVESIRNSQGVETFELIIVADRIPITSEIKNRLKELQVKLIENKFESSAQTKALQILSDCKTDLFLLTQDDVIFEPSTLVKIVTYFMNNPDTTFMCIQNKNFKPETVFEMGTNVGTSLNNRIGKYWNNGDNYLAALGRVMVFPTKWLKRMKHSDKAVSLDAYYYLENKKMGGKFTCLWDAVIYFRNPQNMKEQLRKSSRFQHSRYEMKQFAFKNLEKEYTVPLKVMLRAGLTELVNQPFAFLVYLLIFTYTRLGRIPAKECLYAVWEIDPSTKKI